MMGEKHPTPILARLLLIRSISGHITPDTTPEQAQTALERIRQAADGVDLLAGDA